MMTSFIHLDPRARVYTLRFLALSTIPVIIWSGLTLSPGEVGNYLPGSMGIVICVFIWLHHTLAWALRGLALMDLATVMQATKWMEVTVTAQADKGGSVNCSYNIDTTFDLGPLGWGDIRTISCSAVVPSDAGLLNVQIGCYPGSCDGMLFGVPLLPGSHLFGMLGWSSRQKITGNVRYTAEIYGLQADTSIETNLTSLTLNQVYPGPIKSFRDTPDASLLSGISSFGGFWTFVNGTFALVFGANVVYFAFGKLAYPQNNYRRPRAACLPWVWVLAVPVGICYGSVVLHDAKVAANGLASSMAVDNVLGLQTEGGLPGSENAGIVAFIRERLVDLGEDPRDIEQRSPVPRVRAKIGKFRGTFPWKKKIHRFNPRVQRARTSIQESEDSEAMHTAVHSTHQVPPLSAEMQDFATNDRQDGHARSHRGYILDEIPLLDIDLGFHDNALQSENIEGAQYFGV
ncbi:hypothetical protein C8R45DRAFT_948129 [Mycena sanguinolenta]|nr:hypothetical protein C8R45DRAFT_948129 [Mycena sanguinolenta]